MNSSSTKEKEVATEFLPLIKVYKDGTVERLEGSPYVPPSLNDPETGVSSKDITISQNPNISARLYLPQNLTDPHQKLPILVYFHGGGFCIESAFSFFCHRYLSILVSQANIIAVSVDYRLAPENPLPVAYEDSWAALNWVSTHSSTVIPQFGENQSQELWLTNHGDFEKLFIGGDSAGGNIAHNIAMRAGVETLQNGVKIHGAYLIHPYFWGSEPVGSEPFTDREQILEYKLWKFVYPTAKGGIDDPMVNPFGAEAPSLGGIGCEKLLVCVAGKDSLRSRNVKYVDEVRKSGWDGEIELFEVEGEDHVFHVFYPETENAKKMFNCLASFLSA